MRTRWLLVAAGVAAAGAAVAAGVIVSQRSRVNVTTPPSTTAETVAPAPPSTTPPSTAAPPASAPPTTAPATTALPAPVLRPGSSGTAVAQLQHRLVALGYWLDPVDGSYGTSTLHAVTAFQKAAGLSRDGIAGPVTLAALESASRPAARSTSGRVIEIDLSRQLLLLAVDGRTVWVFDTSTGRVPGSTPAGHFRILRQVNGYDHSPLGILYRPKYFVGGVAVHGYPSVPPYPASHGCVRIIDAAIDWFWQTGNMPIGTPVWVYR